MKCRRCEGKLKFRRVNGRVRATHIWTVTGRRFPDVGRLASTRTKQRARLVLEQDEEGDHHK